MIQEWEMGGGKKVVLRAQSEEELLNICEVAQQVSLPAYLVVDAGHTQIAPGSITAVGIGPAYEELFEPVTGHLKLL
jgi:PTH2 family peptidyl-tRNA hydrolase